jgi:hypothetical protein
MVTTVTSHRPTSPCCVSWPASRHRSFQWIMTPTANDHDHHTMRTRTTVPSPLLTSPCCVSWPASCPSCVCTTVPGGTSTSTSAAVAPVLDLPVPRPPPSARQCTWRDAPFMNEDNPQDPHPHPHDNHRYAHLAPQPRQRVHAAVTPEVDAAPAAAAPAVRAPEVHVLLPTERHAPVACRHGQDQDQPGGSS